MRAGKIAGIKQVSGEEDTGGQDRGREAWQGVGRKKAYRENKKTKKKKIEKGEGKDTGEQEEARRKKETAQNPTLPCRGMILQRGHL